MEEKEQGKKPDIGEEEAGPSGEGKQKQQAPTGKPAEKKKVAAKKKSDPRSKLFKLDHQPLILSSSPHLQTTDSIPRIMWTVVVTLLPATLFGVYYFGWHALWLVLACTLSALITELIINKLRQKEITIADGSAAITGLLLALTLPPSFSISGAVIGSVFAIAIGKQIFGGLGYNIFNPALLGRAFLQASFPVQMTTWVYPNTAKYAGLDAVTAATPLGQFKFEHLLTNYQDLIIGNIGGCIGETSAIAVILGGVYLLIKRYADWRIPVSYLGTVFIFGGLFWVLSPDKYPDPVFHLFSGGLMLGAFFMATDMVTSPITPKGAWIFGIGAGIILIVIRLYGGLPEGVMYSILLMNAFTPLINRYTRPRIFGEKKG